MSFLGCIGSLMAGSGLKEILEMTYAPNAVEHTSLLMLLLVSKALKISIPGFQDTTNDPPSAEDEPYNLGADAASNEPPSDYGRENCEHEEARICFDDLMNKRKSAEDVFAADVLTRIKHPHEQRDVMKNDRTALRWLQYLDMVDILHMFIHAERTGNWRLHLQVL